jgi:assimilatory nitrate reductase electron transfer subunit
MSRILVVGAGPAAHRFVAKLRHHGHRGPVTMLGAERHAVYNRMLLPSVLSGTLTADAIMLPELDAGTHLRLGVTATGINRSGRMVHTGDGTVYRYDKLVLATGARPDPPAGLQTRAETTTLRTLDDCARVTGRRVVVLGGGILGMQAALALRHRGHEVTVVHRNTVPLNRLLNPEAGRLLATQLVNAGLSIHLGRTAVRHDAAGLTLDDGTTILTDNVVLCTGVLPNVELARGCGLAVGTGVVVDASLRTEDPDIHAIGDCAEYDGDLPGHLTRAWDQADTLAAVLTTGHAGHVPGGQITRLTAPGIDIASIGRVSELSTTDSPDSAPELVTLTDPAGGRYAKVALRDQRVVGAVLVGLPQAIATISQLHDLGRPVPSDRLGMLLGAAISHSGPIELPDAAVICLCNNVTKHTLVHAWHGGADTVQDLAIVTRATTGCGSCKPLVGSLCSTLAAQRDVAA